MTEPGAEQAPALEPILSVPAAPGRLQLHYDVQKPVGKGGYAIVYKGIRREDGRVIAVKKVEIFEMSQKKRERCLQEVTLLAQLSHPYIIQMLDAFIDENMLIIIFEWAPAGDLKRLIKKTAEAGKTLDEPAIWGFFSQIVDALRYMHQHRIMHRDIKPANVLVGANGALKLGDLGLGRQLSEQTMEAFSKVGTPYYVSPEVVRGAGYDWKSDVWSLGCLLYELACLRSPFEMEGANLYDVFQKISKGDYEPLPQDMFSTTLRGLVVRMLSVDPARRPELEEVWEVTQSIVSSQSRSRQDIHSAAEHIYAQLLLLEDLCAEGSVSGSKARATTPSKTGQNGKRGAGVSGSDALPEPPADTLRLLHPAFFAEPAGSMPRGPGRMDGSDEGQRGQLGAFLHIFAWLLRVGGRPELAPPIEQQLELRPVAGLSRRGGGVPARPQLSKTTSGSASGNGRSGRGAGGSLANGGAAHGGMVPSPPPPPATAPVCTNVLKGAEAAKRAAQGVGLSTEFAPVTAVAAGYGRAVCSLLQDLIDVAVARVPLQVRKPSRKRAPDPGEGDEGGDGEDGEGEGDTRGAGCVLDDDSALLTAASPMPLAYQQADAEEDEGIEAVWGPPGLSQTGVATSSAPPPSSRPRSRQDAGGGHGGGGASAAAATTRAHRAPVHGQVDPVAWRQELERLAPQLSRIKISAAAAQGMGPPTDWAQHWEQARGLMRGVRTDAPAAADALRVVTSGVADDLDRISSTEARLRRDPDISGLLQQYSAARARLAEVQHDVTAAEDLARSGHAALAQMQEQLDATASAMSDKAAELEGPVHIKQMQDAIRKVRKEIGQMDLRIGVVQQALAHQQRRHLQQLHAAPPGEDGEEEMGL